MKGTRVEEQKDKWSKQVTYTHNDTKTGLAVKYENITYYDGEGETDAMGDSLIVTDGANVVFERTGGRVVINEPGGWVDKITPKAVDLQSQEVSPPQKEFQLNRGDLVRVQRSNGTVETGWEIFEFDPGSGTVAVRKKENGRVLVKNVSLAALTELNRPDRRSGISEAKDFTELVHAIEATGGLQGSQKYYDVPELKQVIDQVRAGAWPLNALTSTGGLRKRVEELLQVEALKKKIEGGA
ncbi:MAG: hypothetical protein AAB733_03660 [Patescibacteria group bacterium]